MEEIEIQEEYCERGETLEDLLIKWINSNDFK